MNICLLGNNLSNLVLAKNLLDREIKVDLYYKPTTEKSKTTRTIGISENNIIFFKKNKFNLENISWKINNIKVFNEIDNKVEILNFKSSDKAIFYLIKYKKLFNEISKFLKNKKNFKKYAIKENSIKKIISNSKYDLIINSDKKNNIITNHFSNTINKDYNSTAYTCFIEHEFCKNNTATQIFTNIGPMAFLPISNYKTSIVFSAFNQLYSKKDIDFNEYIKKYNNHYIINSFSEIEKFKLKFSFARNYYYNNILLFGDALHQIHPLAGQGFNMTLRDIKILLTLIDESQSLGLPIDKNILIKFENKIKHYNFIFGSGIDFIHEFFKFDNKLNNVVTKNIFNVLSKNKLFKNYISNFADKGINF